MHGPPRTIRREIRRAVVAWITGLPGVARVVHPPVRSSPARVHSGHTASNHRTDQVGANNQSTTTNASPANPNPIPTSNHRGALTVCAATSAARGYHPAGGRLDRPADADSQHGYGPQSATWSHSVLLLSW